MPWAIAFRAFGPVLAEPYARTGAMGRQCERRRQSCIRFRAKGPQCNSQRQRRWNRNRRAHHPLSPNGAQIPAAAANTFAGTIRNRPFGFRPVGAWGAQCARREPRAMPWAIAFRAFGPVLAERYARTGPMGRQCERRRQSCIRFRAEGPQCNSQRQRRWKRNRAAHHPLSPNGAEFRRAPSTFAVDLESAVWISPRWGLGRAMRHARTQGDALGYCISDRWSCAGGAIRANGANGPAMRTPAPVMYPLQGRRPAMQ